MGQPPMPASMPVCVCLFVCVCVCVCVCVVCVRVSVCTSICLRHCPLATTRASFFACFLCLMVPFSFLHFSLHFKSPDVQL